MTYNKKDHYHQKAKKEGYVARSAYKLKEIQQKYKIIRPGNSVLDLGCSPGAWSQVVLELIGNNGKLVGIDLAPLEMNDPRITFLQQDIFQQELLQIPQGPFHCILSDMAPKTSGIKVRDQARSLELATRAVEISDTLLIKGSALLIKVFESPEVQTLADEIKKRFQKLERIRPDSTRQASTEIYFLGLQKK